jgi:hypothetical protein
MTASQIKIGADLPEPVKHTEASVLALLRKRHAPKQWARRTFKARTSTGNGGGWGGPSRMRSPPVPSA